MKQMIGPTAGMLIAGVIASAMPAHARAQDQAAQATAAPAGTQQEQQGLSGFAFNAAKVPPKAAPTLDELAAAANSHPDSKVTIVGHTDNVGDARYNQSLAMDRAQLVRSALVRRGVDVSRITVESAGESTPLASNDTRDGRRDNRRAEVIIGGMESRMVGSSQGGTTASGSEEDQQGSQGKQDPRAGQNEPAPPSGQHEEQKE